jgi:hypothetical protein
MARKRKPMKQTMKPMHWLLARLKGLHHLHHQNHPRQMAMKILQLRPPRLVQPC